MEQKRENRINKLLRSKILRLSFLLSITITLSVRGYEGNEHADITQKAITNYCSWVAEDTYSRVGADAVSYTNYYDKIMSGSVDEDTIGGTPWMNHYMDPVSGWGLSGNTSSSAYVRAIDEDHWSKVLDMYEEGNYIAAYYALGRVIHLVEDMGVPAHVQLDIHTYQEYYEKTYAPSNHLVDYNTSNLNSVSNIHNIMYGLATISDQFDSDGDGSIVKGTTQKVDANDGWQSPEGHDIAIECYTGAIKSAGSVLRLFYDTIKPTVELLSPSALEYHSGLIGVPFEAQAKSYEKLFTDSDYIQSVVFYYTTVDDPGATDWYPACTDNDTDEDHKYKKSWTNSIDDNKVWVCAQVVDDGKCESEPISLWIKIDSTKPTVTNTKP